LIKYRFFHYRKLYGRALINAREKKKKLQKVYTGEVNSERSDTYEKRTKAKIFYEKDCKGRVRTGL